MICLDIFWNRLAKVNNLIIQASAGQAFGTVAVREEKDMLLFVEKGRWTSQDLNFTNTLRWSRGRDSISLEHLHQGPHHPVFLFHLAPTGSHTLESITPHQCLADAYFGRIEFNEEQIHFHWRILGPKKNEALQHIYS